MSQNLNIEKEIFLFNSIWQFIFEIPTKFYHIDKPYGVTIEMHTKEANHRGVPHCHAKYKDKEISISLIDYSVIISNGMDSKHKKMAVNYVKEHIVFLKELWNKNPNVITI